MDEEILSILGIDSVEDLTQEEYLSLLMEASVRAQMKGSAISKDALIRITEEIKRVRSESKTAIAKGTSREEARKRKVNPQKVFASAPKPVQRPTGQKLLTASKEKEAEDQKETRALTRVIPSALNTLTAGVNNIVQVMVKDLTMEKKQSEAERKAAENLGREEREEDSEKKVADKSQNFFKGFEPPKLGIFDKLKNFFTMVALGGLFTWLSKPENQDKVEKFTDFIEDHGSKILLGIAALLGLDIGAKILGFLGKLIGFGKSLLGVAKFLASKLFSLPGLAVGATLTALDQAGSGARKLRGGIAEMLGGGDRKSSRGDKYNFADMQSREQTLNALLASPKYLNEEEKKAVEAKRDQYREFQNRMRQTKSLSDQLKDAESQFERMNAGGLDKKSRAYTDLQQKIKDLKTNLEQSLRIEDKMFLALGIKEGMADRDRIMTEGGILNMFDNDYKQRRAEVEKDESSKPFQRGVTKKESDRAILEEVLRSQSSNSSNSEESTQENKPEVPKPEVPKPEKPQPEKPKPVFHDNGVHPKPEVPSKDDFTPEFKDLLKKTPVHPDAKRAAEELFKSGSLIKPVEVSVVPVTPPAGPGPGASSNGHQLGLPKFPTTDQSNMSVAAVAGVYNSPIPRA